MLKYLMPKEEKYFEYFNELGDTVEDLAKQAYQLFTKVENIPDKVHDLRMLEHKCDEISSKITHQLNHTFITPFDREDILRLAKRLDDIADIIFVAVHRLQTFKISEKIDYTEELARIVFKQAEVLNRALHSLKSHKDIINECKEVKSLESEADNIYHIALTKLFEEEKDAILLIKKKEILDVIEEASDTCQTVARVIESIIIKNA